MLTDARVNTCKEGGDISHERLEPVYIPMYIQCSKQYIYQLISVSTAGVLDFSCLPCSRKDMVQRQCRTALPGISSHGTRPTYLQYT